MRLLTLLICCVVIVQQLHALRVPWWQIKLAQDQGPNACVVEEIPSKDKKYWTECKYWINREICGAKTVIRYDCCEGYQQVPGEEGCTGVKPLKNILETAREMGASKFVEYIEESGFAQELTKEGALTLFAPLDEAFESVSGELRARLDFYKQNSQNPILLYHLADNKLTSKEFSAHHSLSSKFVGRKLLINRYSNGIETVNCGLIIRKDQHATNGIVHLIEQVLDPFALAQKDVADIILQDGRFSTLSRTLQPSQCLNRLKESGNYFSILAPSDEAFQKIPSSRLQKILNDKEAVEALLEHHVVPHAVCLNAVTGEHKVRSLGPNRLTFDCNKKGHTVDKSKLRGSLTLGENGVVYMMDDVLLPNRAKSLSELIQSEKLWTFSQLVRIGGLEDAMDKVGDYTVFAPSEAAFYSLPTSVLNEAKRNPTRARQLVLFHTSQGRIKSDSVTDQQILMSLDEENPLRMVVYRKGLGVENAMVEKTDIEGMNGVLHVVDTVLFPNNESAGDVLRKDGNFSIFLEAMERAMVESPNMTPEERKEYYGEGSIAHTLFVPTDQAFRRLGSQKLQRIMEDNNYLTQILRNHLTNGILASASFQDNLHYTIPTQQDSVEIIKKGRDITVNDAKVILGDMISTNGIIHVIDQVLLPNTNTLLHKRMETIVAN